MTTRKLAVTVTILGAVLAVVFLVVIPWLRGPGKRVNRPDSLGAEPRVTIQQNYPSGKYTMTQTQDQKQTIKADGQEQNVSMSVMVVMGMDVSEPDEKGMKSIAMRFTRFKINSNGVKVDTDNMPSKPKDVTPGPAAFGRTSSSQKEMLENIYRELLKVELTIKIGPDGDILEVAGFDDVWDKMTEVSPETAGFIDVFRKSFGNDKMAEMMGLQNKFLPSEPVGVGAIWHPNVSMEIPIVGKMTYDAECELLELKDTPEGQVAIIDVVADITSDGGSGTSMGNASVQVDEIELDHKQTTEINVKTGLITEQTFTQEGTIEMTIVAPDGKKTKAVSKLRQDTSITVEPVK